VLKHFLNEHKVNFDDSIHRDRHHTLLEELTMALKLAINGFGRIGRLVFREAMKHDEFEVVAVNDLTDAGQLAHLLKYDSVHGIYDAEVNADEDSFVVNGQRVKVYAEKDPAQLPWGELGVDVVVECTGRFRSIERGMMTTIHSYTNDQRILDFPHSDPRRARAGAVSMIPTTTGAAVAVSKVLPQLKGKLDGFSMRVPTPNVSCVDLVVELKADVSKEIINAALKEASENELKGILDYNELPLVSIDYNGNHYSSTVDGLSTMVLENKMVKVLAWYDNEIGYSTRLMDLALYIAEQGLNHK